MPSKKNNKKSQFQNNKKEDFEVIITSNKKEEDTIIITSQERIQKWLDSAVINFNNNYKQYSATLNDSAGLSTVLTKDEIDNLALNAQSDLNKIIQINDIVRYYINKDDLIGKVFETIETNINTEYKLSYKNYSEEVKEIIEDFNEQIDIESLIRTAIPIAYCEGNYPMYLRSEKGSYTIDHYPLKVIEVSDYEIKNEPFLICNIEELKKRLKKTYKKTKKGGNLFFGNIEEEIKNNYPSEIYKAFKEGEKEAKLDIKYSGIIRVNNLGRKYGLTPIFKALKSAIVLETFEKADTINAKAKAKKIIFQKLRKETMGQEYNNLGFEQMAYAHESFMSAWKNETVVYTGAPFVESIEYIEPKIENMDINHINYYLNKMMTSLGIGFLNNDKQTFTVANISIEQLMRIINKISEQLEKIIEKWYRVILQEKGIDPKFAPKIKIIDSEALDFNIRKDIAEFLFGKLNCSYETVFKMFGFDIDDEKQKRIKENEEGLDQVFTPRLTIYTNSGNNDNGDSKAGRPKGKAENPDMVNYFDDNNKSKGR